MEPVASPNLHHAKGKRAVVIADHPPVQTPAGITRIMRTGIVAGLKMASFCDGAATRVHRSSGTFVLVATKPVPAVIVVPTA